MDKSQPTTRSSFPAPRPIPDPIVRRGQNQPLYQQIADALRAQIAASELLPGDALPSEHALMRQFGVSRGTIRQARAALRAEGAIGGSQGRRLAVRGAPLTQSLGELVSFTAWAHSLGKIPSGKVIAFAATGADETAATALDLPQGAPVWRLERVRLADGEPLLIERTVFPDQIGALLRDVDLDTQSVYEQLAHRGVAVASACHLIDAVTATPADARHLRVSTGSALLRVRRHAFATDGRPVEWSDDRYRGDRMSFAIENRAGDTGLVRRLA